MKFSLALIVALVAQSSAFSVVPSSSPRPSSTALRVDFLSLVDAAPLSESKDQMVALAGTAAAAVAGAFAILNKGETQETATVVEEVEEEEPEPIDVSIPYDAAARLAFAQTELDESMFAKFKELYETKSVAEVVAKKMARDVKEQEAVAEKAAKALEALN